VILAMTQLHCTISRFVNPPDNEAVFEETRAFLSAVFKALQVGSINILNARCSTQDAIQSLSARLFNPLRHGDKIADMLTQISDQDLTMEIREGVKTVGVNFKIEMAAELYGCTLFYRPGALPLIELRSLFFPGSQSPRVWAKELLSTKAVHNLRTVTHWFRKCNYYGFGCNRYLLWKRDVLLQATKANRDAMHAGVALRDLCRIVWEHHRKDLAKLEASRFRRSSYSRLISAFDIALVEEAGLTKLTSIMKSMDVSVDQWLRKMN
jgi:hypothetical protein